MKIIRKGNNEKQRFADLETGDVFVYKGASFVSTDTESVWLKVDNERAITLKDGHLVCFNRSDKVQRIQGRFVEE